MLTATRQFVTGHACQPFLLNSFRMTLLAGVLLVTTACVSQTTDTGNMIDPVKLTEQMKDSDVNDPTAASLHELAGELLLYLATHDKLPATLPEMLSKQKDSILPDTGRNLLLDPVYKKPFLYTPESKQLPKLPGRIIVYQPVAQGSIGRWVLLINDLAKDGNIVTYVQRVPESMLPKSSPAIRINR